MDVWSVSSCISENFANYFDFWMHNGFWLFNSSEEIEKLAADNGIELTGTSLCYYEVYNQQYDDNDKRSWSPVTPDSSFVTNIVRPSAQTLLGFDVVSFYVQTSPECSPLSCRHFAEELPVNSHCLFSTFAGARETLELGRLDDLYLGPYRILAVYSLP
jgi:hypothetical protein